LRKEQANGLRYPLVGGTRQRHFDGTNLKPKKVPENEQTPTSRVHLGRTKTFSFPKETGAQWEYTANWQTHKPYKAVETHNSLQSRGAPWFPITMIHPLVAWR